MQGDQININCKYQIENYEVWFLPVLVEAASAFFAQMLGEDGLERTKTTRSLDVPDETNAFHRRSLNNSYGLNHFFLVGFYKGR